MAAEEMNDLQETPSRTREEIYPWFEWRRSGLFLYPRPVSFFGAVVMTLYVVFLIFGLAPLFGVDAPFSLILKSALARVLGPTIVLVFIAWKKSAVGMKRERVNEAISADDHEESASA